MPKLSVIICVYNAEKYIRRCAESLFSQTLDDIEYIFIDDNTPDKSIEILRDVISKFPERAPFVHLIHHKENLGVATSRTDGMKLATGAYITHCDSDDWIEPDAYMIAYNAAINNDADIVTFGYRLHANDGSFEDVAKVCSGSGLEIIEQWNFTTVLWNSIIKSSLIKDNDIYPFIGINSGEDTNVILRAYLYAKKVLGLQNIFYHYNRSNVDSITSISYKKNLELFLKPNIASLETWFEEHNQPLDIIYKLKSAIKGDILFRKDVADVKLAYHTWPEVNQYWCNLKWYSRNTQFILKVGLVAPFILKIFIKVRTVLNKRFKN